MAEIRPYHWQGRTHDGGVITEEEASDGSDGNEEHKIRSDLVFVLGSYQIFVLGKQLSSVIAHPHAPKEVIQVYWNGAHNQRARLGRHGDSILDVGWDVNVLQVFSVHVGLMLPCETILQAGFGEDRYRRKRSGLG